MISMLRFISNLWRHKLGNKLLQYTYCLISQDVKTISQWYLVCLWNITEGLFFFKNHAKNEAGRLVPHMLGLWVAEPQHSFWAGFYLRYHFSGHSVLRIWMLPGCSLEHFFYAKFKFCGIFALTKFWEKPFFLKIDMLYIILIEILCRMQF